MRKTEFKRIVEEGRRLGKCYMVVKVETKDNPGGEIIVNPIENFDAKLAYYDQAYNEDMELIIAKKNGKIVAITDALMSNNLNDLNWFIY